LTIDRKQHGNLSGRNRTPAEVASRARGLPKKSPSVSTATVTTLEVFNHHLQRPCSMEKNGVARLALADDHLAACDRDAPQTAWREPARPLPEARKRQRPLQHGNPGDHFVVRGPARLGVLSHDRRLRSAGRFR